MHYNTFPLAIALASAAFATTLFASPIDGADIEIVSRDPDPAPRAAAAAGQCYTNGGFSNNYQLIVDSAQDGGLCGGFWDNLKGRANCAGKSNSGCLVRGSRKIIEFTVGVGCKADEVLGVLWTATEPHVENVKCEDRVFIWETDLR
ncbi:hypothetical protein F4820DRAFT_423117 [Hypoxylon rubiginosum]|uniref:Uncharacterized protein n=1 Tax=Hypoxylon rubiginosum TaxID=110542 RepID=A0ACB9YYU0_9PEZI|nr:hypothetical protein F4820DRAFT_423117 [Hypoxylon rubiginosum]